MEFGQLEVNTEAVERMRRRLDGAPDDTAKSKKRVVEIDENLTLDDLDLEKEIVRQYQKVRQLMDDVIDDDDVPANQRSQCANAVVSSLQQLYKLQEDLQRDTRLKLMESCLIEVIKTLPDSVKSEFFETYEAAARKAGLLK